MSIPGGYIFEKKYYDIFTLQESMTLIGIIKNCQF